MSRRGRCGYGGISSTAGRVVRTCVVVVAALALALSVSIVTLGCGDDASGPEAAVQKWLDALANQDIETLIEVTTSPEDLAQLEAQGMSKEDLKYQADAEMVRSLGSMEFSNVTMETQESGDEAVVTITGGSVTMAGMGVTLDLAGGQATGFPTEFYLHKVDGEWYIDMDR